MIAVKNISKSFDGIKVLDSVSIEFEKGKTNLIIGQSGSGKTVLLKSIVGLVEIDSGEIWFDYSLEVKEKELMIQDLENLRTWRADEDGKLEIIPKKEWKKEMNGRSPDYFDNFNMRMLPFLKNNKIESGDNFNSIFTM